MYIFIYYILYIYIYIYICLQTFLFVIISDFYRYNSYITIIAFFISVLIFLIFHFTFDLIS